MTVFKHGRTFRCDFWWHRHRFKGNTQQLCLEEPKTSNGRIRVHLASRNAKLAVERHNSPPFQVWSEVYFQHVSRRIKRSDNRLPDVATVAASGYLPLPECKRKWCSLIPAERDLCGRTNCDEIDRATCANSCATRPPNTKE